MKCIIYLLFSFSALADSLPEIPRVFTLRLEQVRELGTNEQHEKVARGARILRQVILTKEFRDKILKHTFWFKTGFADCELSNLEVYEKIIEASELENNEANRKIDVAIGFYKPIEHPELGELTNAYTRNHSKYIFFNVERFDSFSEEEVASYIAHEWTHQLGFNHLKFRLPRQLNSVPYSVQAIVLEIANSMKKARK